MIFFNKSTLYFEMKNGTGESQSINQGLHEEITLNHKYFIKRMKRQNKHSPISSLPVWVPIVKFNHRYTLHTCNNCIKAKKRVTMPLVVSNYGLNHVLKNTIHKIFSK